MEAKKIQRCACYTRKSHERGLEQSYNSLDAQREATENYIASQKLNGWQLIPERYDDGGFSGGNMERPALKRLLADVKAGKIDIICVYKLDRLSRSLLDFMTLAEMLEQYNVSFVSVTQDINTSTSAGRMMLNILMTFAQFEREILAERILNSVAGAKKRGKYCGGVPPLGYYVSGKSKKLVIKKEEAEAVRLIFELYLKYGSPKKIAAELNQKGYRTKSWTSQKGNFRAGTEFNTSHIYRILANPVYTGKVHHKGNVYQGEHQAIVPADLWEKVQALVKSNNCGERKSPSINSLKGLVRCGYCGGIMTTTYTILRNRRYSYLLCSKDYKRGKSICPLKRVPVGDVEKAVLHQLGALLRAPTLLANTYSIAKEKEIVVKKELEKQQKELCSALDDLREKFYSESGKSNPKDKELLNCQDEMMRVNQELLDVDCCMKRMKTAPISEKDIIGALSDLEPFWEELFPGEQQHLMNLLIDNIVIYKDSMKMEIKTDSITALVSDIVSYELTKEKHEYGHKG